MPEQHRQTLTAPKTFCLNEEGVAFLEQLETAFRRRSRLIRLDLSCTESLYAEAAVLLLAKVHSIRARSKRANIVSVLYPNKVDNPTGFGHIVGTGLIAALEAKSPAELQELASPEFYYQTGWREIREMLQQSLSTALRSLPVDSMTQFHLLQAVNEAVLNVSNHAYTGNTYLSRVLGRGRWWQCIWHDNQALNVILYDAGWGMAATYAHVFPELSLSEALMKAMQKGCSRWNSDSSGKRGKGSEDLKRVIRNSVESETLAIYTNGLCYLYRYEQGKEPATRCGSTLGGLDLGGTLVSWQIDLTCGAENGNTDSKIG